MDNSKKKLKELIESERYKKSEYELCLINDKDYALRIKETLKFLDLADTQHSWVESNINFDDCLGSEELIINSFNKMNLRMNPIVSKPIKISLVKNINDNSLSEVERYKQRLLNDT